MMTCREVYAFLDQFLEGQLDLLTRLSFGSHLMLCSACQKYLTSYRTALQVARESEQADALPPEVPEQMIQAILASRTAAFVQQPPE